MTNPQVNDRVKDVYGCPGTIVAVDILDEKGGKTHVRVHTDAEWQELYEEYWEVHPKLLTLID